MQRTTLLLSLLVLAGLLAVPVAYLRFDKLRDDARAAQRDLAQVRRDLGEINRLRRGGARVEAAGIDEHDLTRQLREAATAAGLNEPPGTEGGSPMRIGSTDYLQTLVSLRFEPLTLRQLVTFLQHLSAVDPSARPKQIELSSPENNPMAGTQPGPAGAGGGGEAGAGAGGPNRWVADVAVGYVTYAPQKR